MISVVYVHVMKAPSGSHWIDRISNSAVGRSIGNCTCSTDTFRCCSSANIFRINHFFVFEFWFYYKLIFGSQQNIPRLRELERTQFEESINKKLLEIEENLANSKLSVIDWLWVWWSADVAWPAWVNNFWQIVGWIFLSWFDGKFALSAPLARLNWTNSNSIFKLIHQPKWDFGFNTSERLRWSSIKILNIKKWSWYLIRRQGNFKHILYSHSSSNYAFSHDDALS